MKILTIDEKKLLYQSVVENYYQIDFHSVDFYDPCQIEERKCFLFKKKMRLPKFLFTIHWNILDPSHSKEDWRNKIRKKLREIERIEEIKKGNLI